MRTWCPSPLDDGAKWIFHDIITKKKPNLAIIILMSMKIKLSMLASTLLFLVAFYSYGSFSNFRPKSLIPVKEVKGVKVEDTRTKLPYPSNYEIIGNSTKEGRKQITFKTNLSAKEIQSFYRNVMISKDWEIHSTGSAEIFTTTTYRSDKKEVSVTTSAQQNINQEELEITIVSLLIKD